MPHAVKKFRIELRRHSGRNKSSFDHNKFPILWNRYTVESIRKSKVMFIMRGLPGSGKSTLAQHIKSRYKTAVICSTDDYFYAGDGSYHHNMDKLPDAHGWCKNKADTATANSVSPVVIDNTNVRRWEMGYYFALAAKNNYIVIIVLPETSWQFNPEILQHKNKHGCSLEYLESKVNKFQPVMPMFWGWFLNMKESHSLVQLAEKYFQACVESFPEFGRYVAAYQNPSHDDCQISFRSAYNVKDSTVLHCTAFYAGGRCEGGNSGTEEYSEREALKRSIGKAFLLSAVGFVFTPRTVGAKIRLNGLQMKLWGNDDSFCYREDGKCRKIPSFSNPRKVAKTKSCDNVHSPNSPSKGKRKCGRKKFNESDIKVETIDEVKDNVEKCSEQVEETPEDSSILDLGSIFLDTCQNSSNFLTKDNITDCRLDNHESSLRNAECTMADGSSNAILKESIGTPEWPCLEIENINSNLAMKLQCTEMDCTNDSLITKLPHSETEHMDNDRIVQQDRDRSATETLSVTSEVHSTPETNQQRTCSAIQMPNNENEDRIDVDPPVPSPTESPVYRLKPGSRAHLTIGCANEITPVQTGFDIMDVMRCEHRDMFDSVIYDDAVLTYLGDGRCDVQFDWSKKINTIFTGKY